MNRREKTPLASPVPLPLQTMSICPMKSIEIEDSVWSPVVVLRVEPLVVPKMLNPRLLSVPPMSGPELAVALPVERTTIIFNVRGADERKTA